MAVSGAEDPTAVEKLRLMQGIGNAVSDIPECALCKWSRPFTFADTHDMARKTPS